MAKFGKVDAAAGKLTIRHGPLENLGMGPMTWCSRSKPGDAVSGQGGRQHRLRGGGTRRRAHHDV